MNKPPSVMGNLLITESNVLAPGVVAKIGGEIEIEITHIDAVQKIVYFKYLEAGRNDVQST